MRSPGSGAEMNVGVEGYGVIMNFCGAMVVVGRIVAVALETIGVARMGTRVIVGDANGEYPQPDRNNPNEKILIRCVFM